MPPGAIRTAVGADSEGGWKEMEGLPKLVVISLTEAPDMVQPAERAKRAEGFAPEPDARRLLSRPCPFAGFSSSRPHHADPSAAGHASTMTISRDMRR